MGSEAKTEAVYPQIDVEVRAGAPYLIFWAGTTYVVRAILFRRQVEAEPAGLLRRLLRGRKSRAQQHFQVRTDKGDMTLYCTAERWYLVELGQTEHTDEVWSDPVQAPYRHRKLL